MSRISGTWMSIYSSSGIMRIDWNRISKRHTYKTKKRLNCFSNSFFRLKMNALFFISALKLAERQFSTYNIFRFQLIHVEIELEWHRTTCVNYVWYVCKWVSGVCVCVWLYAIEIDRKFPKAEMNESTSVFIKRRSLLDTNSHPTRVSIFLSTSFSIGSSRRQARARASPLSMSCTCYAFTITQHYVYMSRLP